VPCFTNILSPEDCLNTRTEVPFLNPTYCKRWRRGGQRAGGGMSRGTSRRAGAQAGARAGARALAGEQSRNAQALGAMWSASQARAGCEQVASRRGGRPTRRGKHQGEIRNSNIRCQFFSLITIRNRCDVR
jgi:hypothetical protein